MTRPRFNKAILAALALSACVAPSGRVAAPPAPTPIPSTPLDLGDWRRASEAAVLSSFESAVAARYDRGLTLSAVSGDLRNNGFSCAAGPGGRGSPADQVCRRTVSQAGCTHTWQVHVFDDDTARLAQVRGLYDRRCGGDGLLGGPS